MVSLTPEDKAALKSALHEGQVECLHVGIGEFAVQWCAQWADELNEAAEQIVARHVAAAVTQARAAALSEAAEAVSSSVSYGFELRPDGSEDPTAAIYVEGLHDAWQIVRNLATTSPPARTRP